MKEVKKFIKSFVVFLLILTLMPINAMAYSGRSFNEDDVAAYWKFERANTEGEIKDGSLIIKDLSGNGNDLRMNLYDNGRLLKEDDGKHNWEKYLYFSKNGIYENSESLTFKGDGRTGADLITVDDAPINKEEFRNGYTIEFLYYFPKDWTKSDEWMGLMARQLKHTGNVKTMDEPQLGSMSVAVSNCKEIQFLTVNADDSHKMDSAAWSVSMDKGGVWYHIAIVSDGKVIRTFVNGCEAFRDYEGEMNGIFADPDDGRFRIGSSYWTKLFQTIDKFLNGSIEEIRITKAPLQKSDWLVTNPEMFAGEYGTNDEYRLKDKGNYNFVFIPDTQNTVKFKNNVMSTAVDNLIENAHSQNIKAVVHLGDVVENYDDREQYENAREDFYKLAKNVKTIIQPGNHDLGGGSYYGEFFGRGSDYEKIAKDYIVMDSPSGNSSYIKVKAGNYEYLILSIDWYLSDLDWAEEVLKNNPDNPTIIASHEIADCSDTEPNKVELSEDNGSDIWEMAKKYNQVFMMVGGHFHGAGYSELKNDAGENVLVVLADYQFAYNGGNAFFKYAEFSEKDNKIYLSTYSPYSATLKDNEKTFFDVNFLTGAGNDDILNLNFKERFKGMETEAPEKPEEPEKPVEPVEPEEPEEPKKPVEPERPEEPERPKRDDGDTGFLLNMVFENNSKTRPNEIKFDVDSKEKVSKEKVSDISNHWAEDVIKFVIKENLMEVKDEKFNPGVNTSRTEVVKALGKMQKINPENYDYESLKDLKDMGEDRMYVNWAIENKIINGYDDGTFGGNREITREEMAAILSRYMEKFGSDNLNKREISFSDESDISDWAAESIKKVSEAGLLEGREDGKFYPAENLTRAEVAKILFNMSKN